MKANSQSSALRAKGGFWKRVLSCEAGMAATEFALLLPIMVFLFFGTLETSEAMTVNRRVTKAVNTLADLTTQLDTISPSEFDNLVEGVTEILNPASLDGVQINVISVILDGDGNPIVHWSRDRDGNEPYAPGDDFQDLGDNTVIDANGSVIVAEIIYPHHLSVSSYVLSSPITFHRRSIRWPRGAGVSRVQFCTTPSDCTT